MRFVSKRFCCSNFAFECKKFGSKWQCHYEDSSRLQRSKHANFTRVKFSIINFHLFHCSVSFDCLSRLMRRIIHGDLSAASMTWRSRKFAITGLHKFCSCVYLLQRRIALFSAIWRFMTRFDWVYCSDLSSSAQTTNWSFWRALKSGSHYELHSVNTSQNDLHSLKALLKKLNVEHYASRPLWLITHLAAYVVQGLWLPVWTFSLGQRPANERTQQTVSPWPLHNMKFIKSLSPFWWFILCVDRF